MVDVIVIGAGPAGSIAALVLARAGVRVLMVDRETFPRDKLCGDTVNPGALDLLASLGLSGGPLSTARPLLGMIVTGPHARASGLYGPPVVGRVLRRHDLDAWLLEQAIAAGARFQSAMVARGPLMGTVQGRDVVRGVVLGPRGRTAQAVRMPCNLVIGADGMWSAFARGLGLVTTPKHPRRWAFGAYATGVTGVTDVGEMHVRRGAYVGIARMTDELCNVCVVTGAHPEGRKPEDVMTGVINRERSLAPRFESACFTIAPRVLGPLACNVRTPGAEGLLLAGDAAGFIDPMTGDGLNLAMRSAVLAADETLRALETGDVRASVERLAVARDRAFGAKLRFNRVVRMIAGSPAAVGVASVAATIAPGLMGRVVRYAGDVATSRDAFADVHASGRRSVSPPAMGAQGCHGQSSDLRDY